MSPNTNAWFAGLGPMDQRRVLEVMMHEARGEPLAGQAAVGGVLRNRQLGSGKTIEALTDPTQFTDFEFGGREYSPSEWGNAREAIQMDPGIGNATHYYNPNDATPYWGKHMRDTQNIGNHYFGNLGTPALDPFLAGLTSSGAPAAGSGASPMPSLDVASMGGAPGLLAQGSMPVGQHPMVTQAMSPDPFGMEGQAAPMQETAQASPAIIDNPALAGLPELPHVEMPMQGHTQAAMQPSLLAPPQNAPAAPGGLMGALSSANRGLLGGTGFDFLGAILKGFGQLR